MTWTETVANRWAALARRTRAHLLLLLLVTIGAVVHQVVFWHWFVEDAAISFAYAINVADGEGLVPFPGAERVEGYSNPLWVALLAMVHGLGFEVFTAVRWLQVGFTALTVPLAWLAAREVSDPDSDAPIVAAALLAAHAPFALWGSAGLENGLMNLLLTLALWRMWVEARTGGWPLSAWLWLGVTLCRPEAILYAAGGGFLSMVAHLRAGRGLRPTLWWLAQFFAPYLIFQAARYTYFAWPLPNTFYAKERDPELIKWTTRAWKWTRRYAEDLGHAWLLPLYVLGMTGHRGWRLPAATLVFAIVAITLEWTDEQRLLIPVVLGVVLFGFWSALRAGHAAPPPRFARLGAVAALVLVGLSETARSWGLEPALLPVPESWRTSPPWVLAAAAVVLPALALPSRTWLARLSCWWVCVSAVVFAVWSQGDWMEGYRWYAVTAVPGSILLAFGAEALAAVLREHLSFRHPALFGALAVLLVGGFTVPQVLQSIEREGSPDARPQGVKKRVDYISSVRDRLHQHDTWVALDVDMGGTLYWSDFEVHDLAGLVDLPLAHHRFQRRFMSEYVFEEAQPHSAHIHKFWATRSRINSFPAWRRDYFEIPGYGPSPAKLHDGNFIRRDLLMEPEWPHGPYRRVGLGRTLMLEGFEIPSEPAAGRPMFVEVGVRTRRPRASGQAARLWMGIDDGAGHQAMFDLPLAYDWLPLDQWRTNEVFHGRYSPRLPPDLPPGLYTVVFISVDADGTPIQGRAERHLPAGARFADGDQVQPLFVRGEIQFPGALQVLSVEDTGQAAVQDREQALALAAELQCDEAEQQWRLARLHRPRDQPWLDQHGPRVDRHLATCWARWSDQAPDRPARIEALDRARQLDRTAPELMRRAPALADELHGEGLEARSVEDWEVAYRRFSDAVRIDRTRAWSRRYAEEARAHRLGLER